MSPEHRRAWVAEIQFPGKKPIWFGTIVMPISATQMEIEAEAGKQIVEYLPDGWVLNRLEPGAFIFIPDDELGDDGHVG